MTGTARMVVWLRETLDAAQRDAEAAAWCEDAETWRAAVSEYGTPARSGGPRWYIEDAMEDGVITTVDPQASADEAVARHIARHDPAAVLRRIAADRKTLDEHEPTPADFDGTRRCLACGGYTMHPGVGPAGFRKVWPCPTIRNIAEGWGWTEEEPR